MQLNAYRDYREHVKHCEHLKKISTLKKTLKVKTECTLDCIGRESIVSHSSSNQSHCILVPGESLHCQQKTVLLGFLSAKISQHSDLNMRIKSH